MLVPMCGDSGQSCWMVLNLLLHLYMGSYIYDEWKQMDGTFLQYLRGTNNFNDTLVIGLFLLDTVVHLISSLLSDGDHVVVSHLLVPNDIAGLNFVACVMRILEMYSVHHPELGTLYITTKQIVFISLDGDVHANQFLIELCVNLLNHQSLTVTGQTSDKDRIEQTRLDDLLERCIVAP